MLLGWMLPPKPAFMKLTTTPTVRAMTFTKQVQNFTLKYFNKIFPWQVFQDIVLPINKLEDQINTSHTLFDTYPILVYPCRVYDHGKHVGQLRPPRPDQMVAGTNYGMFNDLGVYGVPRLVRERKPWDAVTAMRKMEDFTRYLIIIYYLCITPYLLQICWWISFSLRRHILDQAGVWRDVRPHSLWNCQKEILRRRFDDDYDHFQCWISFFRSFSTSLRQDQAWDWCGGSWKGLH